MTDMFYKKLEFQASLESDTEKAENLRASISYRVDAPAPIVGYLTGDLHNYKDIKKIINSEETMRLKSAPLTGYAFHNIVDSKLNWKSMHDPSIQHSQGNVRDTKILDFELRNFTIEDKISEHDHPFVTYHTFGLASIYDSIVWLEPSYTGERKVKDEPLVLNIDSALVETCKVYTHYFWDKIKKDGKTVDISTSVISVNFEMPKELVIDRAALLQELNDLVQEILIVASFLGRRRADWYMRESILANTWQTKYRFRSYRGESERNNWRDLLADPSKIPALLQQSINGYRQQVRDGIELEVPIRYLLMSQEVPVLEQKFVLAFLSLEKLIDEYYKETDEREILEVGDFNSLKAKLKNLIKLNITNENKRSDIYPKLLDINRKPLKKLLEILLSSLLIDWHDLYPQGKELSIVTTRNRLFHRNVDEEMNIDELWKESIRTQRMVERIILKLMGCSDFSVVPDKFEKEWLQKNGET